MQSRKNADNKKSKKKTLDKEINRLFASDRPTRKKKPKVEVMEAAVEVGQQVQPEPVPPVFAIQALARHLDTAEALKHLSKEPVEFKSEAEPMDLGEDEVPAEQPVTSHGSFTLERGEASSLVDIVHSNESAPVQEEVSNSAELAAKVATLPALKIKIVDPICDDFFDEDDFMNCVNSELVYDAYQVALVDEKIRYFKELEAKQAEEERLAREAEAAEQAAFDNENMKMPWDFALPMDYDLVPSSAVTSNLGLFNTQHDQEENIYSMAKAGLIRSIRKLAEKPNFSSLVNSANKENETPIYLAIKNGHLPVVQFLRPFCTQECLNHKSDSGLSAQDLVDSHPSGIKNIRSIRQIF